MKQKYFPYLLLDEGFTVNQASASLQRGSFYLRLSVPVRRVLKKSRSQFSRIILIEMTLKKNLLEFSEVGFYSKHGTDIRGC